jgi:hypothetical protein
MAKFEIVGVGVEGNYTVKEHLDVTGIASRITTLETENTNLAARNAEIDGWLPDLESELESVLLQIETYSLLDPPDIINANKQTTYSFTLSRSIGLANNEKASNNLRIAGNNKTIPQLQKIIDDQAIVQNAVCIDGADTLTVGQLVGSIELHRFATPKTSPQKILIRPGDTAPYSAARDGLQRHAMVMRASELFVNAALMPTAQENLPRYIPATVTAIDTDLNTISANPYEQNNNHPTSWWEGAVITRFPDSFYNNIPVVYSTCDAAAFTVGDNVVVEYIAGQPTVVGFVDNPQPCAGGDFLAVAVPVNLIDTCRFWSPEAFEVDWGGGAFVLYAGGSLASSVPTGNVTIRGASNTRVAFYIGYLSVDIQQSSTITNLSSAFRNNTTMTTLAIADTSSVTDFSSLCEGCTSLLSFPTLDYSSALKLSRAWYGCTSITSFGSISLPIANDALTLYQAWMGCVSLLSVGDIDAPQAISIKEAFNGCKSLLSVGVLTTPLVTNFSGLFFNCRHLNCISGINTVSFTDTSFMFTNAVFLVNPTTIEITAIVTGSIYVNANPCP